MASRRRRGAGGAVSPSIDDDSDADDVHKEEEELRAARDRDAGERKSRLADDIFVEEVAVEPEGPAMVRFERERERALELRLREREGAMQVRESGRPRHSRTRVGSAGRSGGGVSPGGSGAASGVASGGAGGGPAPTTMPEATRRSPRRSGSASTVGEPREPRPFTRSTMDSMVDLFSDTSGIVHLNVGGARYATSRETLCRDRDSMLSILVNGELGSRRDTTGAYFIDRDPKHFRFILNFLRDGDVDLPEDDTQLKQLLREAYFYQVAELIKLIEMQRRRVRRDVVSRENVLLMLHSAPTLQLPCSSLTGIRLSRLRMAEAVFYASDLSGADLSSCDLERAVFSHCLLRGANLSNTNLTGALLDGANMTGADLRKAQLYQADLKGASLAHADLTRANLQGAKLKGVVLDGANIKQAIMVGVDLRGFNLERANLQGANLERANLTGVNLTGANLQGANLWNAMLAGANLHMANLKDANLQRADLSEVVGTYTR
uniref:BTB domain-containing protein n=1 Tax=Bicosoecida sp. CB-2014 TaxID=1486930 RepID=A0A7S1GBW9_9STRA|mmetsp:Transcript_27960/g.96638  ORF Transcript_27960/g.96638 Transcript_27960/m.96638 type:complete len:493 (+) Transcript_27960:120-1598(+)